MALRHLAVLAAAAAVVAVGVRTARHRGPVLSTALVGDSRPPLSGNRGVLVAGEALFDFLPSTTRSGESCFLPKAGGSPFNVCIAARRLGLPVHFFGGLSTDLFGEELYAQLDREFVDLSLTRRADRPSTLAFVSETPGKDVRYAFFKENTADRCLSIANAERACETITSPGAVHVSLGAITFEDEIMEAVFSALFSSARERGAFTVFDPNVRGNMIAGTPEEYSAKVENFLGLVDVAKASDADVEFLYGASASMESVARRWLELGPSLVVITMGPKGAAAFFRAGDDVASVAVEPPVQQPMTIDASGKAAPVADTVGAGDTLTGALLYGLLGGGDRLSLAPQAAGTAAWDEAAQATLEAVLRAAVTAASISVSRSGCDPPTADDVEGALSALN